MSSSRWEPTAPTGFSSGNGAVHDAAQSLALMHEGSGSGRHNGSSSGWPGLQSSSSYGQLPPMSSAAQSHLPPSFSHSPPPPAGVDPLTGRSFARVEHTGAQPNGTTSFNFP